MATPDSEQPIDPAAPGAQLPGRTIDDLRAQGNAAGARAEFERLLQQGADSGIDPRLPTAIFDSVRTDIRGRGTPHPGDSFEDQPVEAAGTQG